MSDIMMVDPKAAGWHSDMLVGEMRYRLIGENLHYSYASAITELYNWKELLIKHQYEIGYTAKLFVVAHVNNTYFDVDTYLTDLGGITMMRLSDNWKALTRYVGEIQERI